MEVSKIMIDRFVCCLYEKPYLAGPDQIRFDVFKARYEAKSEEKSFNNQH